MHTKRTKLWFGAAILGVVGLALGYYYVILDWRARPFCHKQIMLALKQWTMTAGEGTNIYRPNNAFPNISGKSMDSLAEIHKEMGNMKWASGYRYVPGLREHDPGDLILMYVDRPTRWTWHGSTPTIFKDKAWIVVPVDFADGGRTPSGPGESSERISVEEFRNRLKRTLDFVRTNERPHWQSVVAEHTKFLESGI